LVIGSVSAFQRSAEWSEHDSLVHDISNTLA